MAADDSSAWSSAGTQSCLIQYYLLHNAFPTQHLTSLLLFQRVCISFRLGPQGSVLKWMTIIRRLCWFIAMFKERTRRISKMIGSINDLISFFFFGANFFYLSCNLKLQISTTYQSISLSENGAVLDVLLRVSLFYHIPLASSLR